jgi:hypothetical protein
MKPQNWIGFGKNKEEEDKGDIFIRVFTKST